MPRVAGHAALGLPLLAAVACFAQGPDLLLQAARFGTDRDPIIVRAADLDGDGDTDLVVADDAYPAHGVSSLLNSGTGLLAAPTKLEISANRIEDMAIADPLSEDGVHVLIVTSYPFDLWVLSQSTPGSLEVGQQIHVPEVRAVDVADLDGDGDMDVVTGSDGVVRAFINEGGTLEPLTPITVGDLLYDLAVGDVTGDGAPDAVAISYSTQQVLLMVNDGTGSLGEAASVGVLQRPLGVALGDVTGDGHLDIGVLSEPDFDESFALFVNDGTGGFEFASIQETNNAQDLVLADVSGDGRADPVLASGQQVRVLVDHGDGFEAQVIRAGQYVVGGDVGDMDGDGDLDVVGADKNGDAVSIVLNTGEGVFPGVESASLGGSPRDLVARDLDGNGTVDVAAAVFETGTVRVALGDGAGGVGAIKTVGVGEGPDGIASGDLDGDGAPDLVVSNRVDGTASVLLNDGDASFEVAQTAAMGAFASGVALLDIDGDGLLDLCAANAYGGTVHVAMAAGQGAFGEATAIEVGTAPTALAGADLDLDGFDDLLVTDLTTNELLVLAADGVGGLGTPAAYGIAGWALDLAVGDLDGDGFVDAVAAGEGAGALTVWFGDGSGGFAERVDVSAPIAPVGVAIRDVNGDALEDLLAVSGDDGTIALLLNAGARDFEPATFYFTGSGWAAASLATGDVDLDGDADLIHVSESFGSLFFSPNLAPVGCAADVNGDGGLDVLDFVAFQALWQMSDPAADCDGDGRFDVLDFVCFQQVFQAGC